MVTPWRVGGYEPAGDTVPRARATRRSFCLRCLSKFCPQSELARSSVFIADRIICSRNSPKKAKYLARSLPLDRHRRLPIFQKALIGSPPRRATWTGYYPGAFQNEEQQEQALGILQFKLEVLWSMLDAMQIAYVYVEPPFHSCPELRI